MQVFLLDFLNGVFEMLLFWERGEDDKPEVVLGHSRFARSKFKSEFGSY